MTSGEATFLWIAAALIIVSILDFFVVRRWVKFDRSPASWVRLFFHDFISYTLLVLVCIDVIAATTTDNDFLKLVRAWDWLITFANIVLAIFFRWFVSGLFVAPKIKGEQAIRAPAAPRTDVCYPP